jgi:hypothetical protein
VASRHSGLDSARELGPVATIARNIHLRGCSDKGFSHFREGLCPNSLKVGRIKLPRNQIAGAEMADTWDDDNKKTLILDWATADRIAAIDPAVVTFIPDIAADSRPNMLKAILIQGQAPIEREGI